MMRNLAILLFALLAAGCHAPTPSMTDFAPFGSTVVPPPRTGAIGSSGSYYPNGATQAQPSTTVPVTPQPSSTPAIRPGGGSPPTTILGSTNPPTTILDNSRVVPASYSSPASTAPTTVSDARSHQVLPPDLVPMPATSSVLPPSNLNLRGMPVSDATQLVAPRTSAPAASTSNISNSAAGGSNRPRSLLRIINPKPATNAASHAAHTITPVPSTSNPDSTSSNGWQKR